MTNYPAAESARSAAAAVADALRHAIRHGTYAAGERLTQDALALQHNVSHATVREAFQQLVSEGLLTSEPRRGVSVPRLDADEADEVTKLRSILEPQALAWAIPNMNGEILEDARQVLLQLDNPRSVEEQLSLNQTFHDVLYAPCGRQRTLVIVKSLRLSFERYLRFTWSHTAHHGKSQKEHWELYELCKGGRIDEACALLQRHVTGTGSILVDQLGAGK